MAGKAPTGVVEKTHVQGISTRSVDDLVQAMGMSGASQSHVSRLRDESDGKVRGFLTRPLDGDRPCLRIDASHLEVRRGGRIAPVAVILAIGVGADGRREVPGSATGTSAAESIWTECPRTLTRRGLRGVAPVFSEALVGLEASVPKVRNAA